MCQDRINVITSGSSIAERRTMTSKILRQIDDASANAGPIHVACRFDNQRLHVDITNFSIRLIKKTGFVNKH